MSVTDCGGVCGVCETCMKLWNEHEAKNWVERDPQDVRKFQRVRIKGEEFTVQSFFKRGASVVFSVVTDAGELTRRPVSVKRTVEVWEA